MTDRDHIGDANEKVGEPPLRSGPQADGLPAQLLREAHDSIAALFNDLGSCFPAEARAIYELERKEGRDDPKGSMRRGEIMCRRIAEYLASLDESRSAKGVRTEGPDRAGGHT